MSHATKKERSFDAACEDKELPLDDVAYVNIKKKAEYNSTSDDKDIQSYAKNDWHLLSEQIKNIGPDFIVCCGTFKFLRDLGLPIEHLGGRIYRWEGRLLIDFFHPSCTKSREGLYNELDAELRKLEEG